MLKARLFVATISLVSFVFQPVAYGQTQENWAAEALKKFVKQNQKLGQNITVKEFWEKNKRTLHPEWQKQFFPSVNIQKDERLPQMEVITIKGPNGKDTARLLITLANNKTVSIEFLGGQEKYVRINNQAISYDDFYYGNGLYNKMIEDSVVKQEGERVKALALKSSIVPSYQLFVKMTPRERAEYFLNVRHVLQAAGEVNNRAFESSNKEESASFTDLLIEKAYAANVPKNWVGKKCIVAGYVGNYTKDKDGTYCDHTQALKNFAGMNALNNLTQNNTSKSSYDNSCGTGSLRCQPFVYGFERGNGSTCVKIDRRAGSYQQASRTCDSASPLRQDSLVKDTEAMIKTLLSKENKEAEAFFKDGKVVTEEKYNELMNTVVKDFNLFIDEAIGTCADSKNLDGTTNFGEKYQGDACSVLKNRKLAFEEGFAKLKGKYDKPTPTPAPPLPPTPIAERECKKEGDPCTLKPPGEGRGRCDQELNCVPVVPPPAPVVITDDCTDRPMMERAPAADRNGKIGCIGRAAALPKSEPTKKKDRDSGFSCGILCGLAVFAIGGLATWYLTRSKQVNKPGTYIPPVPGPLPAPPPQPGPITPVPPITPIVPIIPILPTPNPAGSETPPTATPGGPSGVGTR